MGEILNIKKRNPKKIGDEEDLEIWHIKLRNDKEIREKEHSSVTQLS